MRQLAIGAVVLLLNSPTVVHAQQRVCTYVDFNCEPLSSVGMSPALAAWVKLDTAEADHDLDAATAVFTVDAVVSDHAGRQANGAVEVRRWLDIWALPEFREHEVGTLAIDGQRVTWVEELAGPDGYTRDVQVTTTVLNDGKIRAYVSTEEIQAGSEPIPLPVESGPVQDFAVPLLLGCLVPVSGWLCLWLLIRSRR
jgi:hypothetical protein